MTGVKLNIPMHFAALPIIKDRGLEFGNHPTGVGTTARTMGPGETIELRQAE